MKETDFYFPKEYLEMSEERKELLRNWIKTNLYPIKTINKWRTSYGMKHLIESDLREYFSNDEFKGGMIKEGYKVDDLLALNWCFNVSEKSVKDTEKRIYNKRR